MVVVYFVNCCVEVIERPANRTPGVNSMVSEFDQVVHFGSNPTPLFCLPLTISEESQSIEQNSTGGDVRYDEIRSHQQMSRHDDRAIHISFATDVAPR